MKYERNFELQAQVLELADPNGYKDYQEATDKKYWLARWVPHYDISFDAILSAVRELENQDYFWMLLRKYWLAHHKPRMMDWLIFECTPADLCRAYIAAKGGE
jgi:hypothetical protein